MAFFFVGFSHVAPLLGNRRLEIPSETIGLK